MEIVPASVETPSSQDTPVLAAMSKKRKRDDAEDVDTMPRKLVDGVNPVHCIWEVLKR